MNNKSNPMLAWVLLWFVSPVIIAVRNAIANGNGSVSFSSVLIFAIISGIVWAIGAVISWFILKFFYKAVSGNKELELKHTVVIWLVFFLLLFLIPLFKK